MHLRNKLLLSTTMLAGAFSGYARRAYAQCAPAGGATYQCSGANTTTQTINANNAAVTTQPGFSIDTSGTGGNAISITGDGALSYTDTNASAVTGAAIGLRVWSMNDDGATPTSVTITTNGSISSGAGNAIDARTYGTGAIVITANGNVSGGISGVGFSGTYVSITTGAGTTVSSSGAFLAAVSGISRGSQGLTITTNGDVSSTSYFGIYARNYGSAAIINANGNVTSTTRSAIYAYSSSGATTVNVTTGPGTTVSGVDGITVRNYGSGAATIAVNGDVVGTNGNGVYAYSSAAQTIAVTVSATGTVTGGGAGYGIRTYGGPATVVVAGAVTSGGGGAIQFDQVNAFANRLELQPGFAITGNVFAGPGGGDTLAFAGTGSGTFNLGNIDTGANTLQYQNFENFRVENGTWTFTGTTTAAFTAAGGTVEGTGTFGAITVSGGTIAPGSTVAMGALNVTGNLTFNSGVYLVKANDAGQSDLINVGGAAQLNGGTVQVMAQAGTFAPSTQYTIVTAAGGRTGTFAGVTSNFAFLTPSLSYDANNVFLTLSLNTGGSTPNFASFAGSPNQAATAGAAQTLGAGNPVFDALVVLPNDASIVQQAFDALSGELHASNQAALIQESQFIRDAVNNRLRGAFGSVNAPSMPIMAYAPGGPELAPADTERFAVWMHAYGSWGKFDSNGNAAKLDRSAGGFFMGGDGLVGVFSQPWRVGLAAGYGQSKFKVKDRSSSADADTFTIAGYGGTEFGALALRFAASYSWNDIDTTRSIAFPGFASTAKASYDAGTAQVFGEAAYAIETRFASFEPFANLAYVNLRTDGFTESGSAGLVVPRQSNDVTYTTLGLRAATPMRFGSLSATLRGTLGWQHAFGDVTPVTQATFIGSTTPFTVAGTPIARNAALIEAGYDFDLARQTALSVSYVGQVATDAQQHGFNARLQTRF